MSSRLYLFSFFKELQHTGHSSTDLLLKLALLISDGLFYSFGKHALMELTFLLIQHLGELESLCRLHPKVSEKAVNNIQKVTKS